MKKASGLLGMLTKKSHSIRQRISCFFFQNLSGARIASTWFLNWKKKSFLRGKNEVTGLILALCVSLLEKSLLSFPENAMAVNEVPVSRVFLVSLIPPSSSSFSPLITAVYQFLCLVSFSVLDGDPSFPPFFFRNRCKPPFIVKKKKSEGSRDVERQKGKHVYTQRKNPIFTTRTWLFYYFPLRPIYPGCFSFWFPKIFTLMEKEKKKNEYSIVIFGLTLDVGV